MVDGSPVDPTACHPGGWTHADRSFDPDGCGHQSADDILVAINGTAVDSVARLVSRLDDYEVGAAVRLTVLRDGRQAELSITLQAVRQ
jgi:S1-C subfamily serine protease